MSGDHVMITECNGYKMSLYLNDSFRARKENFPVSELMRAVELCADKFFVLILGTEEFRDSCRIQEIIEILMTSSKVRFVSSRHGDGGFIEMFYYEFEKV